MALREDRWWRWDHWCYSTEESMTVISSDWPPLVKFFSLFSQFWFRRDVRHPRRVSGCWKAAGTAGRFQPYRWDGYMLYWNGSFFRVRECSHHTDAIYPRPCQRGSWPRQKGPLEIDPFVHRRIVSAFILLLNFPLKVVPYISVCTITAFPWQPHFNWTELVWSRLTAGLLLPLPLIYRLQT